MENCCEDLLPTVESNQIKEDRPTIPKRLKHQTIFNISNTKYPLIKREARKLGWVLSKREEDDWDVSWSDNGVTAENLCKMKPYQKINHFPGMYALSRKNFLALNLNKLRKLFPSHYKFYPKTWLLPSDLGDLKAMRGKKFFIAKPEASSQGKGIFITHRLDDFTYEDRYVLQEYISKPLLLDGLKFDLRIYVLLAGSDPMKIFLHREGLTRFATLPYTAPTTSNIKKQRMHLTNYAINKNSNRFVHNKNAEMCDVGHKRSLTSTLNRLREEGIDVDAIWNKIKDIVIKTLCTIQPMLSHTYKACQPYDPTNGMCFELLGFDILLDHRYKPWLLEVNHSPSFNGDSPLDRKIKGQVVRETLNLLGIKSKNHRKKNSRNKKQTFEKNIKKAQKLRDKWELNHLGDFEKIYPCEGNFQEFIDASNKIWEESTGTKKRDEAKIKSKVVLKHIPRCNLALPPKPNTPAMPERLNRLVDRKYATNDARFISVKHDENCPKSHSHTYGVIQIQTLASSNSKYNPQRPGTDKNNFL